MGDRQFELAVLRGRAHADRLFGRAVGHRIAKQVEAQLRDAPLQSIAQPSVEKSVTLEQKQNPRLNGY